MRRCGWALIVSLGLCGCTKTAQEERDDYQSRLRRARMTKAQRARALELHRERARQAAAAALDAGAGKTRVVVLPGDDAGVDAGAGSTADATALAKSGGAGTGGPATGSGEPPKIPREPYDGKPDLLRPALLSFKLWDRLSEAKKKAQAPVVNAGLSFAVDLFARLAHDERNVSLAPWDIWTTLIAATRGASGPSAEELRRALHLTGKTGAWRRERDRLHGALGAALRQSSVKLQPANALWVHKDLKLRKSFTSALLRRGEPTLRTGDFQGDPEKTRKEMNLWIKRATGGHIEDLVDRGVLHVLTRLVVTSAAAAAVPLGRLFPRNDTRPGTFYLPDCRMLQVPMMHGKPIKGAYAQDRESIIVDVPLRGGPLSLTIVAPHHAEGTGSFLEKLTSAKLRWWFGTLRPAWVTLSIPRLELGRRLDLTPPLKSLGVTTPFTPKATFGALADPGRLELHTVLHRVSLLLKEHGRPLPPAQLHRRSPAGGLRFGYPRRYPRWRPPRGSRLPHRRFFADRPFVLLIRHRDTGACLYLAWVWNPHPGGRIEKGPCLHGRRRGPRRYPFQSGFPSGLTVVGALDRDDLQVAIHKHRAAIEGCVDAGTKASPPFKGSLRVGFTIRMNGTVTRLILDFTKKKHPATEACVRKEVLRWRFAESKREPTMVGFSLRGVRGVLHPQFWPTNRRRLP
ncbi:MAG: serpin family protein [bacterium]